VKYLTDGMLIREAVSDPCLERYSIIFIDEAHERTVNTDVLLGLLKAAQQKRYDSKHQLKLVVMSATLEEQKFIDFFPSSKLAYIPGRQYPVEVFYTTKKQESYVKAAIDTVIQVCTCILSCTPHPELCSCEPERQG
jgi:HrpA-like RNA helicase